jgi:DNA mismatch repair protein MSH5
MASTANHGMSPLSSTASRQESGRSTPLASFKRPAKAPEGQRKRHKPHDPIHRLEGNSNAPSQAAAPTADQLDAEIRAEEAEDESLDLVIMAVDIRDRETVGCAYYVARHQSLMCMEDVAAGGKEVLDMLKLDIQPTVLLVSPRIDIETDNHNRLQAPPYASMLDDGMLTSMLNYLSS